MQVKTESRVAGSAAGKPAAAHSVMLRRQVPIRFDGEPRSWLVGLPRMPDRMKWPRARDGRPYHFPAQVACADLPGRPWGFWGPRRGWLPFFVDAKGLTDGDEGRDYFHALHVKTLGPERQPPADMPSSRQLMSGYLQGDLALGDDVTPAPSISVSGPGTCRSVGSTRSMAGWRRTKRLIPPASPARQCGQPTGSHPA